MKNRILQVAFLGYVAFLLSGCNQIITPDPLPSQEQTGDIAQMTATLPPPTSGLDKLIEKAQEDLAQRLSISMTEISLVEAVEVEWSDSSLDCPQPGMEYLQVVTPGYRIQLESGGNMYEYHSNRDTYVIYCENSISPNLPKP